MAVLEPYKKKNSRDNNDDDASLSELQKYIDLHCTFAVSSQTKANEMCIHVPVKSSCTFQYYFSCGWIHKAEATPLWKQDGTML